MRAVKVTWQWGRSALQVEFSAWAVCDRTRIDRTERHRRCVKCRLCRPVAYCKQRHLYRICTSFCKRNNDNSPYISSGLRGCGKGSDVFFKGEGNRFLQNAGEP